MTREEFSDMFTTLLNSHSNRADFGEAASGRDIVLDEYEKSVFLTIAQDMVLKSYFDGTLNAQNQGFDDTIRRQVDFSSLITVASLSEASDQSAVFDDRGILYVMPMREMSGSFEEDGFDDAWDFTFHPSSETMNVTDVLYILNEKLITEVGPEGHTHEKSYVVVPINYREYDRIMSKAYAQPFKKQAWRLLQNTEQGFDIKSELIPRWNLTTKENIKEYKIRYIRRPYPIILTDLEDGLSIEGYALARDCELNPILHVDILNKAVELALASKGVIASEPGNRNNK